MVLIYLHEEEHLNEKIYRFIIFFFDYLNSGKRSLDLRPLIVELKLLPWTDFKHEKAWIMEFYCPELKTPIMEAFWEALPENSMTIK